jgi:ABC-type sugar transport system permease subunit
VVAAVAVLAATLLPWSSTGGQGRNGWDTASLALALDEAVHRPVLIVLACVWFAVPLSAAVALVLAAVLPRRWAALALRAVGALLVLAVGVVVAVLVAVPRGGPDFSLLGPCLALGGGAALMALPAPFRPLIRPRQDAPAATGVRS